jgi:hypothetical protein
LDFLWPRLASGPQKRVAIIDDVEMAHRRPLGGPHYAFLGGRSAADEMEKLLQAEKIADRQVRTEALVGRWGRYLDGRSMAGRLLLVGGGGLTMARAFVRGYPNRRRFVIAMKQMLWRCRFVRSVVLGVRRVQSRFAK